MHIIVLFKITVAEGNQFFLKSILFVLIVTWRKWEEEAGCAFGVGLSQVHVIPFAVVTHWLQLKTLVWPPTEYSN